MDVLIQILLPLTIAIMMLSLGLGLSPAHFAQIAHCPKAFWSGLLMQIFTGPCVAFVVVTAFNLAGGIAVGFMILGACPGGGVSNLITKFGRGNVALSVALTAASTLSCALTVPLIVGWSIVYFMDDTRTLASIPMNDIVVRTFLTCIVPIGLGLTARAILPRFAVPAEEILTKVSAVLLALIIIGAIAASWTLFIDYAWLLGAALISMGAALTCVGFLMSYFLNLPPECARTISIELGIQNGAFGIAIAALLHTGGTGFGDSALASALYGVLMYFFIVPLALWYRRFSR